MLGGIGDKTAEKIWEAVANYYRTGLQSARKFEEKWEQDEIKCSTGSKALDELLGGGVTSGQVTQIYGEKGMGKTQLCNTVAVYALLPKKLGELYDLDKIDPKQRPRVVWIDTEYKFRTQKIRQIIEHRFPDLDPASIIENILVYRSSEAEDILRTIKVILVIENNTNAITINLSLNIAIIIIEPFVIIKCMVISLFIITVLKVQSLFIPI